jgi:hypothetical protein
MQDPVEFHLLFRIADGTNPAEMLEADEFKFRLQLSDPGGGSPDDTVGNICLL